MQLAFSFIDFQKKTSVYLWHDEVTLFSFFFDINEDPANTQLLSWFKKKTHQNLVCTSVETGRVFQENITIGLC